MRAQLVERQLALAAVALLAMLGSLALSRDDPAPPAADGEAAAEETWSDAAAGVVSAERQGTTTGCGVELTPEVEGVVHPVLPCGARLVVAYEDREAETAVVEQGAVDPGQEFTLTPALASRLGVEGVQVVRWRFSAGEG